MLIWNFQVITTIQDTPHTDFTGYTIIYRDSLTAEPFQSYLMHVDIARRQEHIEDQIMREEHMYSVKTGLLQVNIQETGGQGMEDCLQGSSSTYLDLITILSSIKVGNYKADTNCGFLKPIWQGAEQQHPWKPTLLLPRRLLTDGVWIELKMQVLF